MIKTHTKSRFELRTLEGIRDGADVVLQAEETGSTFTDSKKPVYLCEVVGRYDFNATPTIEQATAEIIKANAENRSLKKKIDRLEAQLRKERAKA